MNLHYKEFGQGEVLIILHGLFGSSDNWQTLAKALSQNLHVIVPDLRNHGQSPHTTEWSYEVMADDIIDLCNQKNIGPIYLAGHSMGGKTAMRIAVKKPELIKKLMVIDIAPRYYPPHHQMVFAAIDAAEFTGLHSRKEAELAMLSVLNDHPTIQFLLKNLYWKSPDKLGWRFNLPVIREKISEIGSENNTKAFPQNLQVLFLRGEKSNYINEEDIREIKSRFSGAKINTIQGAGHWLHAEKPTETLEQFVEWFN